MAKVYNLKHILERFGTKHQTTLKQLEVQGVRELNKDGSTKAYYVVANPGLDAWVNKQNTFNLLTNVKTVKYTYKKVQEA